MIARPLTVTTTSQSLAELLDIQQSRATHIGLQAPISNNKLVYFGDKAFQIMELAGGASTFLPSVKIKDVFVKAEAGSLILNVIIF